MKMALPLNADITRIQNLVSAEDCEILRAEIISHLNMHGVRFNGQHKRQQGRTDNDVIMGILMRAFPIANATCGNKFASIAPGVLTITEYDVGGYIQLHRDYPADSGATHTMLIYVNDTYEKGETVFYPDLLSVMPKTQYNYNDSYLQLPEAQTHIVEHPVRGNAVVFHTDILHMSNACVGGKKYLIGCKLIPNI
jgi:hypothetical protein